MKKLLVILAMAAVSTASAQKYAYVNSQYILDNIPEYKAAMQQLDQQSVNWQKEIETKYAFIDKLYKDYQAEQILLTDDMKKKRENEITEKEKEVKEFQKSKFGYEGELFKKKQDLVKPIQDKIYNAVKKLATDQSYAVIFDKSSDLIMLYTNPKYDKSDEILKAMGYKAKVTTDGGGDKGGSSTGTGGGNKTQQPAGNDQPKSEDREEKK